MYIVYLILLVIAIVFKMVHWPGSALILLFSILFPLLDVIVQLVRKTKDKEARIWSAVAMLFWAVFMVFKFLHWPGEMVLLVPAVVFTAIMLLRMIQNKNKFTFRLISILLLAVFGIFNSTLKGSDFTLMYMIEDPFDKTEAVPHFYKQRLAYEFYQEGNYQKAEQLIQMNIEHLEVLLETGTDDMYQNIDEENLAQSKMDKEMIQKRSWNNFIPLFPEDRQE